jgi:hypothetical protein
MIKDNKHDVNADMIYFMPTHEHKDGTSCFALSVHAFKYWQMKNVPFARLSKPLYNELQIFKLHHINQ